MATAAVPASTAAESNEPPPGYRLESDRVDTSRASAPLLAYLSLMIGTGLATCHQLSVGLTQAYVDPVHPTASSHAGLLCAVSAAIAALSVRSHRILALGLMLTAIFTALAVPAIYFAFEAGVDLSLYVAGVSAGSGLLIGALVSAALRHFGKPARQLDAVGLALQPFGLVLSLILGAVAVAAFGIVGPWRATAVLSLVLSLLCAWTPTQHAQLGARGATGRLPLVVAALGFCLGLTSLVSAERFIPLKNLAAHSNTVVYRAHGRDMQLVVTSGQNAFELYVDGRLRVSTIDSHRYYEALVTPALAAAPSPKRVLILNAGTGLAEKEALRFPGVEKVTAVCPEPALVRVASSLRFLRERGSGALASPRLELVFDEPLVFAQRSQQSFDVIIVDAPDPLRVADGAAYSVYFYNQLKDRLAAGGVLVAQATSPFATPKTYATADSGLKQVGFSTAHYRATVPTFGDWGFLLASVGARPQVPWDKLASQLVASRRENLQAFPLDARIEEPPPPSHLYDGRIVEVFAEERARTGL